MGTDWEKKTHLTIIPRVRIEIKCPPIWLNMKRANLNTQVLEIALKSATCNITKKLGEKKKKDQTNNVKRSAKGLFGSM